MLSNGMLYYEKSGEGLGAWRSEFCVDDFIFDGAATATAAVFSGIKCGSSIYDFLSAEELATAANNGTDLGRTLPDGLGNVVKHDKYCTRKGGSLEKRFCKHFLWSSLCFSR